jgi:hypothetical protein
MTTHDRKLQWRAAAKRRYLLYVWIGVETQQ